MNAAASPQMLGGAAPSECGPKPSPAAEHRAAALRRLCVQKGLPLGELARRARVSRTTLHHLTNGATARPHAATLARIAEALDVDPRLLDGCGASRNSEVGSRIDAEDSMTLPTAAAGRDLLDKELAFDRSTNTLVEEVYGEQSGLFAGWSPDEWEELYSSFGTGGQLTREGVRETAEQINAKQAVVQKLHVILETHLREAACEVIERMYEMVRPGRESREE